MRFDMTIAIAAMSAVSGCMALPQESETNEAANTVTKNVVEDVAATKTIPVKAVYQDSAFDDFDIDEWAEELAEKAEQGVHVKNGHVLIAVRLEPIEGEYQSLTRLRAKFRAIEFIRYHYQDLRGEFSIPCRVLFYGQSNFCGQCVVVMSFLLKDLNAGIN